MSLVVALDILSSVLLFSAFLVLWRERKHFFSLTPLLPAVALLALGRVCDILLEHPSFRLSNFLGFSRQAFEVLFGSIGNITDTTGFLLLILGFVTIIKYEKEEKKRMRDLETLLPICSSCKKYKTEDGQWLPIEKYLKELGAPRTTHGFCPECTKRMLQDLRK
jgi:hypothetical protein